MRNLSKITVAIGVAGALFLGYCIYFDYKRRGDKDFKRKLHEKRQERAKRNAKAGRMPQIPELVEREATQRYFLDEVQQGESLIRQGELVKGVEHLANAVIVCEQPTQLLQVLGQTLPAEVYLLLIRRMREYLSESNIEDLE